MNPLIMPPATSTLYVQVMSVLSITLCSVLVLQEIVFHAHTKQQVKLLQYFNL